jgi:hypothetical protein
MAAMHVRETLRMARGEVRRVIVVPGSVIRVERGRVWLTEFGGGRDWDLRAGAMHAAAAPGVAVVESLAPAVVEVLRPVPLPVLVAATVSAALRRLTRRDVGVAPCARTDSPA